MQARCISSFAPSQPKGSLSYSSSPSTTATSPSARETQDLEAATAARILTAVAAIKQQQEDAERESVDHDLHVGLKNDSSAVEPEVIFQAAIEEIAKELGGRQFLQFPREIIFLNGPPACGK